jgi:hypothetical protein
MGGATLGREALLQIRHLVRKEMLKAEPALRAKVQSGVTSQAIYIAKSPAGGIAGRSTDTPGSATCDVYRINADGDLEDAGYNVTVYNLADASVAASTYIQVKQELASGKLIVDFEDCP